MHQKPKKNGKKKLQKGVNPYGNGVLRFKVLEIIRNATGSLTTTEIYEMMDAQGSRVKRHTIGIIISEYNLVAPEYLQIDNRIIRRGLTKCVAFFIPKTKQNVLFQ